MTVLELLSELRARGIRLWADGDALRYSAPAGALEPALRAELLQRKPEILALLRGASAAPRIRPAARDGDPPLSFAQQRLWFLDQMEPGSPAYNIHRAIRLTGRLEVGALERALNEIARRHESLRATFTVRDGRPLQVIAPPVPLPLPVTDLRALPGDEAEAEARRLAEAEAHRPFDLAQGPLLRADLLRLGDGEHLLLLTMHHIVSDGWSMGVLLRELAALYSAFLAGRPSPLADLPIQYADFAAWQREWLQGEALEPQLAYWRQQLRVRRCARTAHRPAAPGGGHRPRGGPDGGAVRPAERGGHRAGPAGGRNAVHDAAGGLRGAAAPLQRAGRHRRGHARSPAATASRSKD